MEQPPDGLVRQQVVDPVDHLVAHFGARAQRRALRRLQDALPVRPGGRDRRMAGVVIDLGEVRHHIRRFAAPRDHIVDAGAFVDMLPHQVHQEVHALHPVERRPPLVGRPGGVRGDAPEPELGGEVGERVPRTRVVPVPRMPGEDGVHIGEQPLPHQVHLAGAAFLRRRAVHPDAPLGPAAGQPFLHRQPGGDGSGPEEVVAAGVAGADPFALFRPGGRRLADPRKGVVLGEDPDDRPAGAPLGDERGRHPGDPGLDFEPGGPQLLLQEAGTLLLLVADLGPLPDAERHFVEVRALRAQELADDGVGGVVFRRGGKRRARRREGEGGQQRSGESGESGHGAPPVEWSRGRPARNEKGFRSVVGAGRHDIRPSRRRFRPRPGARRASPRRASEAPALGRPAAGRLAGC